MFGKNLHSTITKESVLLIDPYQNNTAIVKNGTIGIITKPNYLKNQLIASFIANKDLTISNIFISRRIPEEDIESAIDLKVEEEFGISDESDEYISDFIETESTSEERQFNVFSTKSEENFLLFQDYKKSLKYIDFIVPAPLLFQTLFRNKILPQDGIYVFIYLMHKDAFVAIYKNGSFLYSKGLNYSLDNLHEKYCELSRNHIDSEHFLNMLKKDSINSSDPNASRIMAQIISSFFLSINDIIIYIKRASRVENIDGIYIASDIGDIPILHKSIQNYIGYPSQPWSFNLGFSSVVDYKTTPLQQLLAKTSLDYLNDPYSIINLTQFERPPSFMQRSGGKFLVAAGVATVLGLSFPLYYLISSYINDIQSYTNSESSKKLQPIVSQYKQTLSIKESELTKLSTEEEANQKAYESKAKTLESIYDKKVNYMMKSNLYYQLSNDLQKFGVTVASFQSKENNISIGLAGESDKKITEFIKFISVKNPNIANIGLKSIYKDQNNSLYQGVLTMEFK